MELRRSPSRPEPKPSPPERRGTPSRGGLMSGAVPAQLADLTVEQATISSRFARQAKLFPWLLFGPTILYLLVLSIFPLIYSLGVSLYDYTLGGDATFVGLQNYRDLLTDSVFWRKTWTTLQITIFAVVSSWRSGSSARSF